MDHVPRICVLHRPAAHNRSNPKVARIADGTRRYQARPDGCKGVKAFSATPLTPAHFQLPVACADVVSAGVAGHIIESVFAGNVFAFLADNDDKLTLVIDLTAFCAHGEADGLPGVVDGVRAFREYDRIFSNPHADFIRVAAVILANTPDHGRDYRSEDSVDFCRFLRNLVRIEQIALDTQVGIALLLRGVMNLSRRVFIADDFHAGLKALNLSKNGSF